jgi:hypothetical protein
MSQMLNPDLGGLIWRLENMADEARFTQDELAVRFAAAAARSQRRARRRLRSGHVDAFQS